MDLLQMVVSQGDLRVVEELVSEAREMYHNMGRLSHMTSTLEGMVSDVQEATSFLVAAAPERGASSIKSARYISKALRQSNRIGMAAKQARKLRRMMKALDAKLVEFEAKLQMRSVLASSS